MSAEAEKAFSEAGSPQSTAKPAAAAGIVRDLRMVGAAVAVTAIGALAI